MVFGASLPTLQGKLKRASSQFLASSSISVAPATNGGLTIIALARFTGTAGSNERIMDFNNGTADNIILARNSTGTTMNFAVFNSTTAVINISGGTIAQGAWAVWVARYNANTLTAELFQNGVCVASTTMSAAVTNKTLTAGYIGKSVNADAYLNGDISALFVYDYWLDDTQILAKSFATFEHSPTPSFTLDASALSQGSGAVLTSWGSTNFAQSNSFNAPLVQVTADGDKYASFVSTSTPVTSTNTAVALYGQNVAVSSNASVDSTWTLECFFYPMPVGIQQCIAYAGGLAIYLSSAGAVTITGTGASGSSAGTAIFSGWNHVCVSYDGTTYRA
jgi:hypothetical protein